MKALSRALLPFACALVSSGPPVQAAEPSARLAQAVERAFRPLLARHETPGIAVAVTVGGEHYVFGYGVASRDGGQPVTGDTLFEIGSISKTFTATLATYAVTLGKLSLEDHPGAYIPELKGHSIDRASLLHLATYTAGGLPLQFPGTVRGPGDMTAYFRDWKPDAAPGEQRRYSNPSIGLFGHLTAIAMGGGFGNLAERELFPRLGLRDTHIRVPEARMAFYAWGYNRANKPVRVKPGLLGAEAYGIKTSASDLIRYVEANIRPEALEPDMRRAVEATHTGYFRVGEMVQGLGWEQHSYPVSLERLLAGNSGDMAMKPQAAVPLTPPQAPQGPTLFNKTGSTNGFSAYAAFVPAKEIGIVMLANRNIPIPARIAAAHAVLEELARAE